MQHSAANFDSSKIDYPMYKLENGLHVAFYEYVRELDTVEDIDAALAFHKENIYAWADAIKENAPDNSMPYVIGLQKLLSESQGQKHEAHLRVSRKRIIRINS